MGAPEPASAAPTVSVVIPAFNRAQTIRTAIESVLRQTYADFEVIVVDDCSADGTLEAAQSVSDPRLHVFRAPRNLGSGGARNYGVERARGRWVAFQDSDDEWLPAKLEKQMAKLTGSDVDHIGCYCGMLTVTGLGHEAGQRSRPHYTPDPAISGVETGQARALLEHSFISTQTLIAKRDVLVGIGGFDTSLPAIEDWDLALRLAAVGSLAFIDEPLVLQSFSENSLSRDQGKLLAAQQLMLDKHLELYTAYPRLLAQQYYLLAGGCRRLGDLHGARSYLLKALRLRPGSPRILAMSGYVALRSVLVPLVSVLFA